MSTEIRWVIRRKKDGKFLIRRFAACWTDKISFETRAKAKRYCLDGCRVLQVRGKTTTTWRLAKAT